MAGLSDSLLGLEGRLSIYMIYTKKVSFSFTNIYIAQNGRFVQQFFLGLEGRLSIYMIIQKKLCNPMFFISKNQAKFLNLEN